MSIKNTALAFIVFFGVGFSAYYFQKENNKNKFTPVLLQSKFSSKGVVDRIIQLDIKYDEVKSDSDKANITAEISMPFDFNDKLYYRWKIGQDVSLIEGELSGDINGILKSETKKISIVVSGFSKENNHHIGFEVYGMKNGKNIYGDALIASDLENTFENTVQNVERIKASQ